MSALVGYPLNFPSLMGAYLAVNAIPDAYCLVDGPDCALYKSHYIHGRHDLGSTLLNVNGRHRVSFTNICAQGVTHAHDAVILKRLRALNEMDEVGLVLLTALPGCSITGVDYGRLLRELSSVLRKPALEIPPPSLVGDWLDGFAMTLRALARHVDLSGGNPKPENVAVVGYLMDRNEGDHQGNLAELRRLLAGLSLDLVSVWPGGQPYASLRDVRDAAVVVSLPYGREAARVIAERTGARLVETGLPFGLGGTGRWLRQVAEATGRTGQAEAFITAELRRVIPRLEWTLPLRFLGKRVLLFGDPYLMEGLLEISEDAGLQVTGCVLTSRPERRLSEACEARARVLYAPQSSDPELIHRVSEDPPDLVVSNRNEFFNHFSSVEGVVAVMEFGFPAYSHHALADAPFLGYAGCLAFFDRMLSSLEWGRRMARARSARPGPPEPREREAAAAV